jgi:signal transduction histidine kinase/HAMP domain-containing protein
MRPAARLTGVTVGVTVGITAVVVAACLGVGYVYSVHHFESLIEAARSGALAEGDLIRSALEHQMIENGRKLIARLVDTFGRQPGVERVLILDRAGIPRHSAGRAGNAADLRMSSPTCQACHRLPPELRASSRVLEANEGAVLRTVLPIGNGPACHGCHAPAHRINGVLIVDKDITPLRASMDDEIGWTVGTAGMMTLLLVAGVAAVVRFAVQRRLRRFETTARLIAAGDLERRLPVDGGSTLSWLASEFNSMADSVTGLAAQLRGQREQLETIINSIDDGIAVLDRGRRVLAANDAFVRRVGRDRADVVGCGCGHDGSSLCGVSGCPTLACLETGERQVRLCERRAPDGTPRWEEVHTSPVRDADGGIPCVVEVWRDISERRSAEARLAESHRLASLGLLASGFSHELNTPLATVLMCVEGILRDAGPAGSAAHGEIAESAAIAREQLLRCRGITQNFLRLSRGQPSPGDIVDVQAVLDAAARLVAPTAAASRVALHVDRPSAAARVRADEGELQHVVINVLLNAVQACAAGGRVEAGIVGRQPVRIRVRDTGCGIAAEYRQRIFEPFFGLRQGGTGLGLFLSLDFVRRWSGDITMDSTPGAGTTVDITLPALADDTCVGEVA